MLTARAWIGCLVCVAVSPLLLTQCSGSSTKAVSGHSGDGGGSAGSNAFGSSSGGSGGSDDGPGVGDDGSAGLLGSDGGSGGDGSATGDATGASTGGDGGSTAGDGGAGSLVCSAPTGGQPCDPGQIACGGSSCSTRSHFCCVTGSNDGGPAGTCSAYNGPACGSGALSVACDEAADCSGGLCCEQSVALGVAGPTQCMTSCPVGWFQVCKSDSECGGGGDAGGGSCIVQTCTLPSGLLGGGSSVVVEACAVPPTLTNLNNRGALAGCVAR
jgi:hypothetical protein